MLYCSYPFPTMEYPKPFSVVAVVVVVFNWELKWFFLHIANKEHQRRKKMTIHYCSYIRQAMTLSRWFSRSAKYTSRSKEKTDNASTDKTEQVTLGMKLSLSFQIWSFIFFFKSNNKYCLVALFCVVTRDRSLYPVQAAREAIVSSSF